MPTFKYNTVGTTEVKACGEEGSGSLTTKLSSVKQEAPSFSLGQFTIREYILQSNCRQSGTDLKEGRPQKQSTREKISQALKGEQNPLYKDGRRSYRDKIHAKSGQLVHHKNGKRTDNSFSNLEITNHNKHNSDHHREKNFQK